MLAISHDTKCSSTQLNFTQLIISQPSMTQINQTQQYRNQSTWLYSLYNYLTLFYFALLYKYLASRLICGKAELLNTINIIPGLQEAEIGRTKYEEYTTRKLLSPSYCSLNRLCTFCTPYFKYLESLVGQIKNHL